MSYNPNKRFIDLELDELHKFFFWKKSSHSKVSRIQSDDAAASEMNTFGQEDEMFR